MTKHDQHSRAIVRAGVFAAVIAASWLCTAAWGDDGHVYYYFDQPRSLTVDPSRIAVLQDDERTAQTLAEGFAGLGVASERVLPQAAPGWSLVEVEDAVRDAAGGVEALVEDFAREPGVLFASPVFVDEMGGPMFVTPGVLVAFREDAGVEAREAALQGLGLVVEEEYGLVGVVLARAEGVRNGFETLALANALAQCAETLAAEPDMAFTGRGGLTPNDPLFPQQWELRNTGQSGGTQGIDMKAPDAWDITLGDASIITVIIDTGVQQNHPDIHQVPGTDTTSDASTTGDPVNQFDNHGTPVAGCVSANINNGIGMAGIAPGTRSASARTMISSNSSGNWSSFASWTVATLNWSSSIGARVTNNSNYYGFTSAAIATAYANTRDAGMVHFASAGNNASNQLTYPSILSSVNAVSAVNRFGNLASFSNFNVNMSVSAPGASVVSTDRTGSDGYVAGDYVVVNGTSFASPYAAGVAALVLSIDPTLNAADVEQILQQTALDLGAPGFDMQFGHGMVNAFAAVVSANPGSTVEAAYVIHNSYTGTGSIVDSGKSLHRESVTPTLLDYSNLINTSHGINGVGFEVTGLGGTLTEADFEFRRSPEGSFSENANPPSDWELMPSPPNIDVTLGAPSQIAITWPNGAIMNRWLRIVIKANANTRLLADEVYYLGHLMGETGPTTATYSVSFADITPIRLSIGTDVDSSSEVDIDKSGVVSFADISAMRGNVGATLTNITVPTAP